MSDSLIEAQIIPARVREKGLTRCFVYRGASMTPLFKTGDLLFVCPLPPSAVSVGDVVVFFRCQQAELVVHRVVGVSGAGLVTRGDANSRTDPVPLSVEGFIGRVEALERGRRHRKVLGGRVGMLLHRSNQCRRQVSLFIRRLLRPTYRALRSSAGVRQLLGKMLSPQLEAVRVETCEGPVVKFIHRGRTVARWWPQRKHLECRKPYDLVIPRPDGV